MGRGGLISPSPCWLLFVSLASLIRGSQANGVDGVCRAAAAGDVESLQRLCSVRNGGADDGGVPSWNALVNTPDENGLYPGHHAAMAGCVETLRAINGMCPDALLCLDPNMRTPAHHAAQRGHEGALRLLGELCGGDSESMGRSDRFLRTPVHLAAEGGHEGALHVLSEIGQNLSPRDSLGRYPSHLAAAAGQTSCLRALHQLGAAMSVEAGDRYMRTPAHHAAETGHWEVFPVILELCGGETLSAEDCDGRAPANLAAQAGQVRALETLSDLGAWVGESLLKTVREQRPFTSSDVARAVPVPHAA